MPLEKQSLNNFLPNGFETLNQEGYKENFSEDKIATGYEKDVPDIVSGPNLNNLIDVVGKNTNTLNNYVEYLNGMPINNMPTVNKSGQLDYIENNFLNKNQITNCILEAPNGIATYSGNTITIKQGLKALAPNGRNADRTLRNNEYKVTNDFTIIVDSIYLGKHYLYLTNNDGASYTSADHVFIKSSSDGFGPPLTPSAKEQWYDDYTNYDNVHLENQSNWDIINDVIIGEFYWDGSIISDFITYEPIDILKRNNKSEISGWGMPSSKYIDLTLGASSSTYIAPANGYFCIRATVSITNGGIFFTNNTTKISEFFRAPIIENEIACKIKCKKGENITISYSGFSGITYFRFYYAEGEV